MSVYPIQDSLALRARLPFPNGGEWLALYASSALDIILGVAFIFRRRSHWVIFAQLLLILTYSAIIAIGLPEFLTHPFGPVLKNSPLFVATLLLLTPEASWNRSYS